MLLDKAIYFSISITILIAFLSLVKLDLRVIPVESSDKIGHVIAYFFLMISWLYALVKKPYFQKRSLLIIASCFIYGIVIEILQTTLTSYRTASYLDILANSTGIVVAVLTFYAIEKKNVLFNVKSCKSIDKLIKLANY